MKNHNWKIEEQHLAGILTEFDKKIELEEQRAQQTGLETNRQDFLTYSVTQLKQQQQSPYFGRIDVAFADEEGLEQMYIGSATFFDEEERVRIYDWRAPIASLFYEGTLGELQYETPAGMQKAHAYLKRDIVVRNQTIQSIYDVENQEQRLMETLNASSNKEGYLENITATIQKEQNEIIRHRQKKWLIVNGCAGSGKTSILLQRIAYLMYYAHQDNERDMLLLSRNQLFAHYISHVIPSLTGTELYQKTLWQKTVHLLKTFHLHYGISLVENPLHEHNQAKAYLPDMEWVALIHDQMVHQTIKDVHFKPIYIKGYRLFSERDFNRLCEQTNPKLTIHQQLTQIQGALERSLKRRLNKFFMSPRAVAHYEKLTTAQVELLTQGKEFSNEAEYYQVLGSELFADAIQQVQQQVEVFAFVDVLRHARQWIKLAKERRQQLEHFDNAMIPIKRQDEKDFVATPEGIRLLLYIATTLTPVRTHEGYSHLFVDEVQDVSLLLLSALTKYYFRAKFTVVGDAYQAFDAYPTIFSLAQIDPALVAVVFPHQELEQRVLNISYRCTAQITRFSNGVLDWELDKNVFPRSGELPIVWYCGDKQLPTIKAILDQTPETMHTTGIICRTLAQAKALQKKLVAYDALLLANGGEYLGNPFVVTTIQAAKGMEFDQVVIVDVSAMNYSSLAEQAMLYTSCTRAKHRLHIVTPKEAVSPFIENNRAEFCKQLATQ